MGNNLKLTFLYKSKLIYLVIKHMYFVIKCKFDSSESSTASTGLTQYSYDTVKNDVRPLTEPS